MIKKITGAVCFRLCKYWQMLARLPVYLSYFSSEAQPNLREVIYIVENANWSIKWDGIHMAHNLQDLGRLAKIGITSTFYKNKILHYGSSSVFETQAFRKPGKNNKHIVTFFHGKYGDDPLIDKRFDLLKNNIERIDAIAYSTTIMKQRFLELGIPEDKLFHVPIGVDLNVFKPLSESERQKKRAALGIPDNAFVLGSFQKDGNGWGEGLEPKMIKGPDVFVEVATQLAKTQELFVLLSGPARGYVKKGLSKANIPFHHEFFDNPDDVVSLFQLLDAYVITSREEGGPKAIMESMGCGVPLVTTDVGMARDVMDGFDCGFIHEIDDVEGLVSSLEKIAGDTGLAQEIVVNSLERVKTYDWSEVAKACETMYKVIEQRS